MRLRASRMVLPSLVLLALALPAAAFAADGYSLFGDAMLASPGSGSPTAVQVSSIDGSTYSGIDFDVPAGMTFADLTTLSTDYKFTQGTCVGGSPRFSVGLTNGTDSGYIFIYVVPPCTQGFWFNTGNLVSDTSLIETGQLPGGVYSETVASAKTKYSAYTVTGIFLVADSGWLAPQAALVDNIAINGATYTFEGVATCKNNGWTLFANPQFKNQGECVSYFSRNK